MAHHHCSRLHVSAFGFALGVFQGLGLLILGWDQLAVRVGAAYGLWSLSLALFIYRLCTDIFRNHCCGYEWGFIDGFITGVILAAIYNACKKCNPAVQVWKPAKVTFDPQNSLRRKLRASQFKKIGLAEFSLLKEISLRFRTLRVPNP